MTEKNVQKLKDFFDKPMMDLSEERDREMDRDFLLGEITLSEAKKEYLESVHADWLSPQTKIEDSVLKNRPMLVRVREFVREPIPRISVSRDKHLYKEVCEGRKTIVEAMAEYVSVGGGFWILPNTNIREGALKERPMLNMIRPFVEKGFSVNFFDKDVEGNCFDVGLLNDQVSYREPRNTFGLGILTNDGKFYPLRGKCDHEDMYKWLKLNGVDVSNSIAIMRYNDLLGHFSGERQRPLQLYSPDKYDENDFDKFILLTDKTAIGLYNICCLFDPQNANGLMEASLIENNAFGFREDMLPKNNPLLEQQLEESRAYANHNEMMLSNTLGRRVDVKYISKNKVKIFK